MRISRMRLNSVKNFCKLKKLTMITINPNTYNGFDILCRVYENQSQSYWRSINRDENKQICVRVFLNKR